MGILTESYMETKNKGKRMQSGCQITEEHAEACRTILDSNGDRLPCRGVPCVNCPASQHAPWNSNEKAGIGDPCGNNAFHRCSVMWTPEHFARFKACLEAFERGK